MWGKGGKRWLATGSLVDSAAALDLLPAPWAHHLPSASAASTATAPITGTDSHSLGLSIQKHVARLGHKQKLFCRFRGSTILVRMPAQGLRGEGTPIVKGCNGRWPLFQHLRAKGLANVSLRRVGRDIKNAAGLRLLCPKIRHSDGLAVAGATPYPQRDIEQKHGANQ